MGIQLVNRSNYSEDTDDYWAWIRWRGAVESSIRGKKGQAFLKELLATLDAMPDKKLIEGELVTDQGQVCAIGSVLKNRGIDTKDIDIYDAKKIANICGIASALVREIEYINDEEVYGTIQELPEKRWQTVRDWVANRIRE